MSFLPKVNEAPFSSLPCSRVLTAAFFLCKEPVPAPSSQNKTLKHLLSRLRNEITNRV